MAFQPQQFHHRHSHKQHGVDPSGFRQRMTFVRMWVVTGFRLLIRLVDVECPQFSSAPELGGRYGPQISIHAALDVAAGFS